MSTAIRFSLRNLSDLTSVIRFRAGDVLPKNRDSVPELNRWGSRFENDDDRGVLYVVVTLAESEHNTSRFNQLKRIYPTAPIIRMPVADDEKPVERIIVYGVNGTSVTLFGDEITSYPHKLLSTPITELDNLDEKYQVPSNSTAIHKIERITEIAKVIEIAAADSSMEQVFGLLACGLPEQAKLLASLPMKMVKISDDVVTCNDEDDGVSVGTFFPHENSHVPVADGMKVATRRPHRDSTGDMTIANLFGDYDGTDGRHYDYVDQVKNPASADYIIEAFKKFVNPIAMYIFFHTIYGSQFVDIVAKLKGVDRTAAMVMIAKHCVTGHAEAADILIAITNAQAGNFGPETSKYDIFDYADVHSYAINGVNSKGQKDELLAKKLCMALYALTSTRTLDDTYNPRYGAITFCLEVVVCRIPANFYCTLDDFGPILAADLAKAGPIALANFVMNVMVPAKATPGYDFGKHFDAIIKMMPMKA